MNDKNFIEELRQKREEYGVTQTRLAVACGISREYYNRIEKGKQPLNDELKGVIEKQIERFNPQEPLFLLIDYFRVRFPTTDALAIIRDVLQLKPDYMLYEDCTFRINGAPFPRQRCKRLAPAVRYPFVVTC